MLQALGVIDLSFVTNTLIGRLEAFFPKSPLWQALVDSGTTFPITFSGALPDALRKEPGCQLSFSLIRVTENRYQRNSPLTGPRAQTIPFQPMSLDLYYLLTAFADKAYEQEQQAMTIAMQFFYQTCIVHAPVSLPGIATPVNEEFTITMEVESTDEMSKLWQSITVPYRLSVMYRVSVVLLTPPAPPALAKPVLVSKTTLDPALFPFALAGQLIGASRSFSFASPDSTGADPRIVNIDYSPAVVAAGQRFFLYGAHLNQAGPAPKPATSFRVYLIQPDGSEVQVTDQWKVPETNPAAPNFQTDARITLDLPNTVGPLPLNSPPPGVYQLRAGSDSPPEPFTNRTNAVPFTVVPRINVTIAPPAAPILTPVAGTYTLNGEGFIAGGTHVLLDTIVLIDNPAGPSDGEFRVVSRQQVEFRPPLGIALGRYTVRVRVNNVEAPPSWWIVI
jgi:hypothetical protein